MIGRTIGHYLITSKLGEGGMGEVFLAGDTRLDRKVAVKFLSAEMADNPDRRLRFLREAKASSALNHPNICIVYDVGETDDGHPFIVMEYVEGNSLHVLIQQGSVAIPKIVDIAIQIADALDAAHSNKIVHRDIKPANIILNWRGQVKVLDFGLAKRMLQDSPDAFAPTADMQQTQSGQVLGTPSYMSPEQALGKEIDYRTDIFSLGVVLYIMSTRQLPFAGSSFGEIVNKIVHDHPPAIARLNYDVSPELERITLKCLQKAPESRYQSARELMVDLKNLSRELVLGNTGEKTVSHAVVKKQFDDSDINVAVPISLDALKSSDIFMNYAAVDDQPLLEGKPGWVSQLHRNLEVRVEQLSGEKVSIARLPDPTGSDEFDDAVLEHLARAKAMISVVSPPFIKSAACRTEVEHFWRNAEQTGGQWVEDKARLLKVLKTAVPDMEMPPVLAEIFSPLFGFEFFEYDPQSGRVREFDETFGSELKQRFFERVYDLAYDVCQVLRRLRQLGTKEASVLDVDTNQRWVYLATTTSDVQGDRDRIKRELLERGHVVLPDAPLPLLTKDAEDVVQDCLQKCTIAIHLLGRHYGVTPEDSSESIPALQVRLTAEQAKQQDLQRLIWMPGNGETADERQRDFIARVQEDPRLHHQAELIEGNLNLLKKDLIRRLNPPEEKSPTPESQTSSNTAPKLYLICDSKDESSLEALEDYLFDQGLEVCLPAFDGSDAEAETLHQDNLLTCDAVLVYYGAAPKAWVDIKLRELLKVAGYGRETPIQVQAVYIVPPDDHRKERFRSHRAAVIRQPDEFTPSPELNAFVGAVQEAYA